MNVKTRGIISKNPLMHSFTEIEDSQDNKKNREAEEMETSQGPLIRKALLL